MTKKLSRGIRKIKPNLKKIDYLTTMIAELNVAKKLITTLDNDESSVINTINSELSVLHRELTIHTAHAPQ